MSKKGNREIKMSSGIYNEGSNSGVQAGRDLILPDHDHHMYDQHRLNSNTENENVISTRLPELRRLIIKHFSDSDLRDICFDLRLDYESLPGTSKSEKVRELLLFLDRSNTVERLVNVCRELRSSIIFTT
ncbi:MAG: hypothetical protein IPM53_31395 [Anaerolineaceae bacterium]|nr:hypothetical protein [Anaerolineaceae bacterium]